MKKRAFNLYKLGE